MALSQACPVRAEPVPEQEEEEEGGEEEEGEEAEEEAEEEEEAADGPCQVVGPGGPWLTHLASSCLPSCSLHTPRDAWSHEPGERRLRQV